jgi:hypothetical protein
MYRYNTPKEVQIRPPKEVQIRSAQRSTDTIRQKSTDTNRQKMYRYNSPKGVQILSAQRSTAFAQSFVRYILFFTNERTYYSSTVSCSVLYRLQRLCMDAGKELRSVGLRVWLYTIAID